jgi:predicted ATPase
MAQRHIYQQLERTHYLGPFRQPPLRQYPTRGASPIEVGPQGESTATILANEIMRSQNRTHISEISKWLHSLGGGKKLDVQRIAASDMFDLDVTLPDDSSFAIADLGYGLSQVLPVLTQCSFAADGSILLFEQPELHLHSLAVRPLASVFIDAMRRKKLTILAETHSVELVGQFQRELRAKTIKLDELIVYRVHREAGHTMIKEIQIDSDDFDIYEQWEKGISVP